MRLTLLCVGRLRPPWVEADARYRRMLSGYLDVGVVEVRDAAELARRLPREGHVVALDRRGRALDSPGWASWLDERLLEARDVTILIGGDEGLPEERLAAAAERVSLGPPTYPHQLARIIVLEQLYRAARIRAGEPYHR